MRARLILLVVAILVVAAFTSLNWDEVTRTAPLSFGAFVTDAPLGLILVTLLGIMLITYIISAAAHRTQTLVETRHHYKTMEAQRDLADKAESSRFTELRTHFDTQMKDLRQREVIAATEFEKSMVTAQRDLRTNLEQMNRMLLARIGELEQRLDTRLERIGNLPHVVADRRDAGVEPTPTVRHPL